MILIKKWFSEEQIEKTGVASTFVDSIDGIKAEDLAKQIAFRDHKKASEILEIHVCPMGSVSYNNGLCAGRIEEYFSKLEAYKQSIL